MVVILNFLMVKSVMLCGGVDGVSLKAEDVTKSNAGDAPGTKKRASFVDWLFGEDLKETSSSLPKQISGADGVTKIDDDDDSTNNNAQGIPEDLPLGAEAGGGEEVDGMGDVSDDENIESSVPVDSSRNNYETDSEATSTAPMVQALPSGNTMNKGLIRKQNPDAPSEIATTLYTRESQQDTASSSIALSAGLNELFLACRTGDANVVDQIIERGGIDINKASDGRNVSLERLGGDWNNNEGTTALMIASEAGQSSVVQRLLACPEINVNAQDELGYNALMCASRRGQEQAVKDLLTHPEIQVNMAVKDQKYTALILACRYGRRDGQEQVVQHLLGHPGIRVNQTDKFRNTALSFATDGTFCENENIADMIRNKGGFDYAC